MVGETTIRFFANLSSNNTLFMCVVCVRVSVCVEKKGGSQSSAKQTEKDEHSGKLFIQAS